MGNKKPLRIEEAKWLRDERREEEEREFKSYIYIKTIYKFFGTPCE